MLTVRRALTIGGLKEATLVAGSAGLEREIRYVTVMEVPDLVQWLKGSDFIVTSLYSLKDDLRAQVQLIRDLAARGCAALAVKTKRYVDSLSDEVKAVAEETRFPLIEIPRHVTYIDIISPLMEEILNAEAGVLRRADEAFRWLQEVVLSGQGLKAALLTLSRLVESPLVLECPDLGLVLQAPEYGSPFAPLDEETKRHLAATCRPLGASRYRAGRAVPCLIIPLLFGSLPYAYLTVEEPSSGLTPCHGAILEHATALLAAEIMKLRTRAELERQNVNGFVEELINQNFTSEEGLIERGRYLGLDLSRICLPLALDIDRFRETIEQEGWNEGEVQTLKSRLQRELISFLRTKGIPFVVGQRSDSLVILTSWSLPPESDKLRKNAFDLASQSLKHLKEIAPGLSFTAGIGRVYPGLRGVAQSYKEARRAITLGRKTHGPGRVYEFSQLGIYRLICSYPDEAELRNLCNDILGNIMSYDRKEKIGLLATLKAYFANNEDIHATARSLYVHPHTVRYRLNKAGKLAKLDLSRSEDRFQLYLALKIADLIAMDTP
ncbi:MAG: PucR family transcriptional regulator, purine catabolism regulatory protein [Bacillota bacterium]|nr:PucR family transcriptional regulator, purine catabolism regulatory protein [Bacillota bacterium]